MSSRKIVVLGTGGTIAGSAASATDSVSYTAAQVTVESLLRGLPGLAPEEVVCEQIAQIDSKDMDFEVWRDLAVRCTHWLSQPEVAGIVVTHGTDTMEETAWFLHCVLDATRPVVLTGAMRPSTALSADGPRNLLDAAALARTSAARGVMVVCAGRVHGALDVAKTHPYRLDAFDSGEAGVLGFMEEGAVRMVRPWPRPPADSQMQRECMGEPETWPRVEIVMSHAGASPALVEAVVASGARGIVVAATGNGSLHHALEAALLQAQAAGVRVVRCTRCAGSPVIVGEGDGRLAAVHLSPVKARIALMLQLMRG